MPKLSIIVPVYNVGTLFKRCIGSIINQSFKNIEIIVINDGSTDDFHKIFLPYSNETAIRLFENKSNCGLGFSRNIGIASAQGDYLTFVDSDDWIDLDMYKVMMLEIEEKNPDVAICGIKNEFENYISSEDRYTYMFENIIDKEKALALLSNSESNNSMISPVVWNKIYRTDIILNNNIRFINNSYWEDDIFTYQFFINADKISLVPDVYYHYYQREKSITNDFSKKHIDDLIAAFRELQLYLQNQNLWDVHQKYFQHYFDRAITSMCKMLFQNEKSSTIQKKYILYFYEQFAKCFSISEAILYLDIERIRRLFI